MIVLGNLIGIPFWTGSGLVKLPTCISTTAVSWFKDLNSTSKTYEGSITVNGLLDFDGVDNYISANTPTLTGSKQITFKTQIDATTFGTDIHPIIVASTAGSHRLLVYLTGTHLAIYTSTVSWFYSFASLPVSFNGDEVVFIINQTGEIIDSVYLNDQLITHTSTTGTAVYDFSALYIMGRPDQVPGTWFTPGLFYDFHWNNELYYAGYPDGNLDSAWVDTIGSNNGTVHGLPTTTSITYTGTIYAIDDAIGERTDEVYYGQYLDATSGQINFYRTGGTFDYTDPSDGSLIEGVSIPGDGLYTIPANGICDIGIGRVTVPVYNLGDEGTTDFVDSDLNGLADGLEKTYSSSTMVFSIITGNGFDGNAQQIYMPGTGTKTRLDTEYINVVEGDTYTVNLDLYQDSFGGFEIWYQEEGGLWNQVLNDTTVYLTATSIESSSFIAPSNRIRLRLYHDSGYFTTSAFSNVRVVSKSKYSSFYPICERAGTVLHDVMENSTHISVDTPIWSESLYGSDYLNQYGYVDKTDSDALEYDWETGVDGTPVTLDDSTLIPLSQWEYVDLTDSEGELITDSEGEQLQVKQNL